MPNFDSTGPMGMGTATGKGMGVCAGAVSPKQIRGCGRGYGGGQGRRCFTAMPKKSTKENLHIQKKIMEERLKIIDKQLENLQND